MCSGADVLSRLRAHAVCCRPSARTSPQDINEFHAQVKPSAAEDDRGLAGRRLRERAKGGAHSVVPGSLRFGREGAPSALGSRGREPLVAAVEADPVRIQAAEGAATGRDVRRPEKLVESPIVV